MISGEGHETKVNTDAGVDKEDVGGAVQEQPLHRRHQLRVLVLLQTNLQEEVGVVKVEVTDEVGCHNHQRENEGQLKEEDEQFFFVVIGGKVVVDVDWMHDVEVTDQSDQ